MRYIEWIVMFVVAGLGIGLANFVGFDVNFMDSLPGILILLAILYKILTYNLILLCFFAFIAIVPAFSYPSQFHSLSDCLPGS